MKFKVENMSCGHCVRAINQALHNADPSAEVQVNLEEKQVDVESTLNAEKVQAILNEEGYPSLHIA